MLTIVVPAHNEEAFIADCLSALIASDPVSGVVEVIVAANGCTDRTVDISQSYRDDFEKKGWSLVVLDLPQGGKLGALTAADAGARGDVRVYIDADVTVSPGLIAGLARALRGERPAYASGQVQISGKGWFSRNYARFWSNLPFMREGVPGCGVFAMNAAGRARWDDWPEIIADDFYARMKFSPKERTLVEAPYDWPIAEGFSALVKVRDRQNRGVAEVTQVFPDLMVNDDATMPTAMQTLRLALRDPLGFAAYSSVAVAVKLRKSGDGWSRSR